MTIAHQEFLEHAWNHVYYVHDMFFFSILALLFLIFLYAGHRISKVGHPTLPKLVFADFIGILFVVMILTKVYSVNQHSTPQEVASQNITIMRAKKKIAEII